MVADRQKTRFGWLLAVGALVLIALALVALGGPTRSAGAAPRVAALSLPAPADREVSYTAASSTTLPLVFKNLIPAQLVVNKAVAPTTLVAAPGQVVTYTVVITNVGHPTAELLSIVDTLPAGFAFESMAPGSDVLSPPDATTGTITWTGAWPMAAGDPLTLVYRVTASALPGEYTNQVYVTASGASVPTAPAQATVTVQSAILMHEDFNNGINAWTAFLNHHRLSPGQWYYGPQDGTGGSGALTHDCSIGPEIASDGLMMYLQPGAQDWTDYRVDAYMYLTGGMSKDGVPQPEQGDPIGFWIRGKYQESEFESQWVSGYYVVIVGMSTDDHHYVKISKMQNPDDCDACLKPYRMYNFDNPLEKAWSESIPGAFEHYRWYHLAVEVRANNIKVYLEDQLVLDWTDPMDKGPYLSGTVGFKTHETMTASFDDITVTPLTDGQ